MFRLGRDGQFDTVLAQVARTGPFGSAPLHNDQPVPVGASRATVLPGGNGGVRPSQPGETIRKVYGIGR
jgi:hypothetical protein